MVDFKKIAERINLDEYKQQKEKERLEQQIKEELRRKTCNFTGHRPGKYMDYNITHENNIPVIKATMNTIEVAIKEENVERFISGGAIGFDTIAFYVVHNLKEKYPHIKNILSLPFEQQDKVWSEEQKKWYRRMIDLADEVIYIDTLDKYKLKDIPIGVYHPAKMQKRNEHMVDHSYVVIALWDGSKGGTGNCVRYVQKSVQRHVLYRIDPRYNYHLDTSFYGY